MTGCSGPTDGIAPTVTVLVVDDDPLARRAIRTILGADPSLSVTGEADDGERAFQLVADQRPDVVLMDVRMPRTDGLTALRRLRQQHPDLPVIMLTTFSDRPAIEQSLADGAAGFLLKTSAPEEIVRAVHAAHDGGVVLSPSVSRWVVDHWIAGSPTDQATDRRVEHLTPRQREVLSALAEGDSNAEIGRRLHLSEGTVKGYVSEIIATLQVRNRVEAAILAHRSR